MQVRAQRFTPVSDDGGWLEWEELVQRRGFRPTWTKRKIWKAYHRA